MRGLAAGMAAAGDYSEARQSLLVREGGEVGGPGRRRPNAVYHALVRMPQRSRWPLIFACVVGVYVGLGLWAYSRGVERWPLGTAAYFVMCTFFTVGYGDFVPSSPASKLFTLGYVLVGSVFILALFGVMYTVFLDSYQEALDERREQQGRRLRRELREVVSAVRLRSGLAPVEVIVAGEEGEGEREGERGLRWGWGREGPAHAGAGGWGAGGETDDDALDDHGAVRKGVDWVPLVRGSLPSVLSVVLVIVLGASLQGGLNAAYGWTTLDAYYWAVTTAATVGYGDLRPMTAAGRVLAAVYIPAATGSIALCVGRFAARYGVARADLRRGRLLRRELTPGDLARVGGASRGGGVTEADFIAWALEKTHRVERRLVDDIRARFRELDVFGTGMVGSQDLAVHRFARRWRRKAREQARGRRNGAAEVA